MTISRREITLLFIMGLVALFLGTGIARADEQTAKKKYPIPGHGVLELNLPASWKAKIHTPQENMPPTIIFSPATGNDFQVTMMVLLGKKEEPDFNGPEKVKTLLEKEGQKLLPRIVEAKIELHEIKGVTRTGYYFSAADKNPEPGEYRYMTQAGIGVGDLLLHITVLHRVKGSGVVKETLAMLRGTRQNAK